jgi:SAM-dependent methyltransferase
LDPVLIRDIIEWDVETWSAALRFWESAVDWRGAPKMCLEVGAGNGGLSLWLALKGHRVVCSDLTSPANRAARLHAKYGVSALIEYAAIDATDIPDRARFDIAAFKSILGGIGRNNDRARQQRAIDEMFDALKPGGMLLFAENLRASPAHRFFREKFVGWGKSWRYVTLAEMREFLRQFTTVQMRATGVIGVLGRTERERNLLARVDTWVLNRLCPDECKYLVYGVAVKS